jgi:hypothetical protein
MRATPRSVDEAVLRIALRSQGIFGDKIADFDKVRFRAWLIQFPAESVLEAFHNVFQRIFRFVFRGHDSFVHSGKEFVAHFDISGIKPIP